MDGERWLKWGLDSFLVLGEIGRCILGMGAAVTQAFWHELEFA